MALISPLFSWRGAIMSGDSELTPSQRLVAMALSLHMSDKGSSCFPSTRLLCEHTGLSKPAVIKARHALVDKGWLIMKVGGGRQSNVYTAVVPPGVNEVYLSNHETVQMDYPRGKPGLPESVIESVRVERTPLSIESSVLSNGRKRDFVFEAFSNFFQEPATKPERDLMNAAVKQTKPALIAEGVDLMDEQQVSQAVFVRYRQAEREFSYFGPMALVNNWTRLKKDSLEELR